MARWAALLAIALVGGCTGGGNDLGQPEDLAVRADEGVDQLLPHDGATAKDASSPPDLADHGAPIDFSLPPDFADQGVAPIDSSLPPDLLDQGVAIPDLTAPDLVVPGDAGGWPPTCSDQVWDGDESDLDCGGSCPPCPSGKRCVLAGDCVGGLCLPSIGQGAYRDRVCALAATCLDGISDGDETDTDCGGPTCTRCTNGKKCTNPDDCLNGVCTNGTCAQGACFPGAGQYCAPGNVMPKCDPRSGCQGCCQGSTCQTLVDFTMLCGVAGFACYSCGGIMPPNPCLGAGHCLSNIPGCFDNSLQRVFAGTSDEECGPRYKQTSPNDTGYCMACTLPAHCVNLSCQ
jgi:hypothetical protein